MKNQSEIRVLKKRLILRRNATRQANSKTYRWGVENVKSTNAGRTPSSRVQKVHRQRSRWTYSSSNYGGGTIWSLSHRTRPTDVKFPVKMWWSSIEGITKVRLMGPLAIG